MEVGPIQNDYSGGLTSGIIGLMSEGKPRKPDDWGALSAWAWGLSRAMDYFETDKSVDAKQMGVEGHSRYGKAALLAAALDPRWAIVYPSCSGEGGAKPSRRNFGETVDNVATSHWLAPNFHKYAGHWNDLPVDSDELIALVAPRPIFLNGGTGDQWADPHGAFLAAVAAGPVYRLLGKKDLGSTEMPAPDTALTSGEIAFRYHAGAAQRCSRLAGLSAIRPAIPQGGATIEGGLSCWNQIKAEIDAANFPAHTRRMAKKSANRQKLFFSGALLCLHSDRQRRARFFRTARAVYRQQLYQRQQSPADFPRHCRQHGPRAVRNQGRHTRRGDVVSTSHFSRHVEGD